MLVVSPARRVTYAIVLVGEYKRAGTVVGQLIYAQVEVYGARMLPVSGVINSIDP